MAAPYEERAEEVIFLLEQCGLARYAPAFRNDDVDDSCLGTLTPEDLVDLGLPMGPRVRLARAIRERNAAAASAAPSLPPPPPLPVSMRAATPPPFDNDDDDDDLCQMCWDNAIDCKCKHCEKAFFCSSCVANWRRQGTAKAQGSSCPTCRQPEEGQLEVVDLEGRPLDAPRAMAWGGAAPAVVPFPGAAEAEARRRREAEAARVVEAARVRAVDAAALATAVAARHAGVWAARALAGKSAAAVREEALERARAAVSGVTGQPLRAYVDAYATAASGAFEDAVAAAAAANALDAAVDRDNAAAAIVSVHLDEAVASCRRDAAALALLEVDAAEKIAGATAAASRLDAVEAEILMLVDSSGGKIGTNSLPFVYQRWYGKELDYPGQLTMFLKDLPGVEVIPGRYAGLPSWIRRATAPAPAPAPSRSASPDPTAAPWMPPPPAACVPYPIYAYPPPAYFVPLPPPMPYGLPVPMPPMSNNPFVLQPIPWEQAGVAHDPVTAERPRPGRMSARVRQARREAAQADVSN